MDWLFQKETFSDSDLKLICFHPEKPCVIKTVRLQRGQQPHTEFKHESLTHTSEKEYVEWLKTSQASTEQPGIVLVMHSRLGDSEELARKPPGTMVLPYQEDTFRVASQRLFQHRSLSLIIKRISTAVFNKKLVKWENEPSLGPSIVAPVNHGKPTDIALSATFFAEKCITYAVMYGCADQVIEQTTAWLKRVKGQAIHPLIMPMIFVELERKRLFNLLDFEQNSLQGQILHLKNKLRSESQAMESGKTRSNDVSANDCESTKVWIDISSLKNGLESLKTQLENMIEHSKELNTTFFRAHAEGNQVSCGHAQEREVGEKIETRLREMIVEFDSKVRTCDSLLGGMALAAQMESNYYSRQDAKVAISIANATKQDGSQMRNIAWLGMVFLPGTFLATFFSMPFFDWNTPDTVTMWWMKRRTREASRKQLLKDLESEKASPV
nr:uncharacterized protein CTRU02_07260 [Colletotrichum truncatum]KAF6791498.1 hypothetical protein CTRU02_07260 [Colletotrichum truncatum]